MSRPPPGCTSDPGCRLSPCFKNQQPNSNPSPGPAQGGTFPLPMEGVAGHPGRYLWWGGGHCLNPGGIPER